MHIAYSYPNALSIIIFIENQLLPAKLFVYFSAARQHAKVEINGHWTIHLFRLTSFILTSWQLCMPTNFFPKQKTLVMEGKKNKKKNPLFFLFFS